jgi:FkbM family methyltransferase
MRRKHSALEYTLRILSAVIEHPANRDHPVRACVRAIGWQLYKRSVRRPRDIDYYGLRLRCYPDSNSASAIMYFGPRFDYNEMIFTQRYLRQGDGYLDVGANVGAYTIFAAALIGDTGLIHAFEPSPIAALRLRENIGLNGLSFVVVHEAAVCQHAGTVQFLTDFDVSNAVSSGTSGDGSTIGVRAVRLDDVLGKASLAMGKLDVEGSEVSALLGAEAHLRAANPPVWQVEVIDGQLRKQGTSRRELQGLFEDHGFRFARFDAGRARLDFTSLDDVATRNVLAISRERRGEVVERIR